MAFASANLPFSVADNEDFRYFVCLLNSSFDMPHRQTVAKDVCELARLTDKRVIEAVVNEAVSLVLISDGWSDVRSRGFLGALVVRCR